MLIIKRKAGQGILIGKDRIRFLGISYDLIHGVHIDPKGSVMSWSRNLPKIGDSLEFGAATLRINDFDEKGHGVILGVDVPREVRVLREELPEFRTRQIQE